MYFGVWVALLDIVNHAAGVPLGECCLRGDGDFLLLRGRQLQRIDIGFRFHQAAMPWHFAKHTLWFWMPLLADIENIVALGYSPLPDVMRDRSIARVRVDTAAA